MSYARAKLKAFRETADRRNHAGRDPEMQKKHGEEADEAFAKLINGH